MSLPEILDELKTIKSYHQETRKAIKICASAGAQGAGDVVSESTTVPEIPPGSSAKNTTSTGVSPPAVTVTPLSE